MMFKISKKNTEKIKFSCKSVFKKLLNDCSFIRISAHPASKNELIAAFKHTLQEEKLYK